jgi:predicted nicotinamide N-methyase
LVVGESDRFREFVRRSTAPAPVPLAPELVIHQATDAAALWEASIRDPEGWPDLPYWAIPWAGGQALARYLLDRPETVSGRRVADFATGSGLVALAAARAGAARVLALDVDPISCAAVAENAALNRATVEVRMGDAIGDPLDGFDVVTAGDIFYERPLAERALPWLRALAARGALVLLGDPGRSYSPAERFTELAVLDTPAVAGVEGRAVLRTRVVRLTP